MTFPAPDTGLSSFPRPDTGHAIFPGPDRGMAVFPPQPIPLRIAEVTADIVAGVEWVIVPVRTAEVVAIASAAVDVVPVPEIVADVVAVVDAQVSRDYDNIDAEVIVDAAADAVVAPVLELDTPGYSGGTGGRMADFAPRWFTASNTYASTYRLYAAGLDWTKPVGLLVHFHGDGAYEYNNPTDSWSLGGPGGIIARARAENMMVLVPLTPDDAGDITWWEWWSPTANPQYAVELISQITSTYNIDLGRLWFSGYSGGAQFVTRDLMPALGSMVGAIVGGFVVFGGGGAPRREVNPTAAWPWQCRWVVGALDDGSEPGDGFNAKLAAEQGEAWYRARGFPTSLTVLPGKGHDLGGLFGGHVGDTLAGHRPAYGPGVGLDATASVSIDEIAAVLDATVAVEVEVIPSVVIEGYVTAPVVVDATAAATVVAETAIEAVVVTDAAASADLVVSYFTNMGAYMTAQYSGWTNFTWNRLWPLAAMSGYPGTVLTNAANSAAAVVTSGGAATISAKATYLSTSGSNQQVRIVKNGSTVLATGAASSTTVATATWTGTLAAGDLIAMEIYGDNRGASDRKIQPGETVTYLTINAA